MKENIAYTIEGHGQTLVLLHGFLESKAIWQDISKSLSAYGRIVCVDLPGHGDTPQLAEVHDMTLMADAVKTVFDRESIENAILIGHSMGGYVTLEFARLYPNRLKSFGLLHSHAMAETEAGKENRNRVIELLKTNKKGFITQFIPDLFAEGQASKFTKELKAILDQAQNMTVESIIAAQLGMRDRRSYLNLLSETEKPVLFIQGHQDKRCTNSMVLSQAQLCKHAEILLINAGHMGFLENREEVTAFFKKQLI